MYAGGQPMQLATSYVPWSLAEGTQMVERDSGPGGIYSRLADVGHGPVRFTEEVATRMPTPEEAGSSGSRTLSRKPTTQQESGARGWYPGAALCVPEAQASSRQTGQRRRLARHRAIW
jgi:UTRA domain